MKVIYYFRLKRQGVYSIEVLFERIIQAMGNKILPGITFVSFFRIFSIAWKACLSSKSIHHVTGDINYVALFLRGKRTVLTIHDIGHYSRTLKGWKKIVYRKFWFEYPLRKVAVVTTVSEFTKKELIETFNVLPSKIQVVHNPFPEHYVAQPKEDLNTVPKILQVGGGQHKNLDQLLKAIEGVSCELLLVRPWDDWLAKQLDDQGVKYTWYSLLSDQEMYQVYQQSDVVFFASLYEGFGMPILEAQAVGRPVITSNGASMPEVAGAGAVLVDPHDFLSIRKALLQLFHDDNYRKELVKKGFQNTLRFKPKDIARHYLDIYRELYQS